ncbi:hypothetical protein [Cyclobacterium xiamenense]|uniref:hypothetical protein n=1 Tax=Cyclobacterium xiamenense TaxID=1297121 RepID=UPI0035D0B399
MDRQQPDPLSRLPMEEVLLERTFPWDKPGLLKPGLGNNRYLQYADQADIQEEEKGNQC